jgi:hypothetical protein
MVLGVSEFIAKFTEMDLQFSDSLLKGALFQAKARIWPIPGTFSPSKEPDGVSYLTIIFFTPSNC